MASLQSATTYTRPQIQVKYEFKTRGVSEK